jgi:hypothetical protein
MAGYYLIHYLAVALSQKVHDFVIRLFILLISSRSNSTALLPLRIIVHVMTGMIKHRKDVQVESRLDSYVIILNNHYALTEYSVVSG